MITIEESVPNKNSNYLTAEDIFYIQFNDISFYIEDEEQENFFFCILKNLFPDIRIEKIFPLNGKENVINECKNNRNDKKKIFIVDKDFDDILNKIEQIDNLFYLERYSIENHLIEEKALVEYIIGEKPKLKRDFITDSFDLNDTLSTINSSVKNLIYLHVVVQNKCSNLKNISLNYERFFDFDNGNFNPKTQQFEFYKNSIVAELSIIDKRLTLNSQLKKVKKLIDLNSTDLCLKHIPGKYLIKMLKQTIESLFGLVSRNTESFCYRISQNCDFHSLNGLKVQVNEYLE